MSDDENKNQVPSNDDAPEDVNENASHEQTIEKSKTNSENMEVHHHPKVEKKNFKEYFLEFLMIFLAVTMGFFAEQLRETFVEHKHEKEFMESLVKDLTLDIVYLKRSNDVKQSRINSIDSVLGYFKKNNMPAKIPSFLITVMKKSNADLVFISHSGTIDQLKNSGALRLIHEPKLVDSIESYYQQIKRSEYLNNVSGNNQEETRAVFQKLIEAADIINNYEYYLKDELPPDKFQYIGIHKEYLSEYVNRLMYRYYQAAATKEMNDTLQQKAARLVNQITKEYHLSGD